MILLELSILFIIYVASFLVFVLVKAENKGALRKILIAYFSEEIFMWGLFLLAIYFNIRLVTILKFIVPVKGMIKLWFLFYLKKKN